MKLTEELALRRLAARAELSHDRVLKEMRAAADRDRDATVSVPTDLLKHARLYLDALGFRAEPFGDEYLAVTASDEMRRCTGVRIARRPQ